MKHGPFQAIVMGASAGGLEVLRTILQGLPATLPVPILIVQHISPDSDSYLPTLLGKHTELRVKEAEDKETLSAGVVYVAPPNYHLLVEADQSLALCAGSKVNFSRPAIDVLFESAAEVFVSGLVGVILTGANHDGARGLARIKAVGGLCIVQDPQSAQVSAMPLAALAASIVDYVRPAEKIAPLLNHLLL
ncbi:MAG: chemotaxis protein CheB [Desulfovibrionales bacterium]|nr:chemotaxis protein CheB [Desulfovibrionales bacterium]